MFPAGPGGRPRNNWDIRGGYRNRRLVRLYTLTRLTKKEIRKVLKAEDFNPSESDIQKRLQLLFPKDYAKEHRSFRPSTNQNSRLRSSLLHSCRDGRVSKSRRYGSSGTRPARTASRPPSSTSDMSDGLPLEFWNYSHLRTLPRVADFQSSTSSPESQIIDSSRLMLDGSIIRPRPRIIVEKSSEASRQAYSKPGVLNLGSSSSVKQRQESIITLESLKIRLSNRRSSSLQNTYSALRLSFPRSYRSSVSWRSSWVSGRSWGRSIRSDKGSTSGRISTLFGELSKDEQTVWNDTIDESQFYPSDDLMPAYSFLTPHKRLCCASVDDSTCSKCGFYARHAQASAGDSAWYTLQGDKNQTDKFNNTPLLYSAASGVASLYTFTHLIPEDIDVHAKNTANETFLHVLDTRYYGIQGIGGSPMYLSLLNYLQSRGFCFSDRDCHGRTILHGLLKRSAIVGGAAIDPHDVRSIIQDLSDILEILKPDLNALDNQGHNVGDQLIAWGDNLPSTTKALVQHRVRTLVELNRGSLTRNISFRQEISSVHWKAEVWLQRLENLNLVTWIDIHGDTPLTAILKKWKEWNKELELQAIVRQLVSMGIGVNSRDRNGNTALAIAAIRGLRPCVAELLISGAMPNTRNYRGDGIVAVSRSRMLQASKASKNDYYARILSCVTLLADFGAKLEPTQYEEWLPTAFKLV